MKKTLFIYNPKAGRGTVRESLPDIVETFSANDMEVVVHPTVRAKDATETVEKRGKDFDQIICSGGDGTLDEVVTGMMRGGFSVPIGYIPAGSTNDFAASVGIPSDFADAASGIVNGKVCPMDVGRLDQDYFIYVAAFGAFTDVSYKTSQTSKNMLGHLAYLIEGMKSLPSIKGWKMSYQSDTISGEGEFLYGMITNSNSVGGFKGITGKNIDLDDGLFEVTLITVTENLLELPSIAGALLNGDKNQHIITFKTSHLEFESDEMVPWTTDGEYGGSYRKVAVDNIQGALPLIIPVKP